MSELIELARQVKDLLPISTVIMRRIKLQKKGKEYMGLCPFHNEKSPSFTVNDDKQFFHCFGCSEHGDIFKFVMLTEGLNYIEALKKLASEIGLKLPVFNKGENIKEKKIIDEVYEINDLACKWFMNNLNDLNFREAKEYLRNRGLKPEIIEEFKLGYYPNKLSLSDYLKSKNYDIDILEQAGLIVKRDNGSYYDRFVGRIIFPIITNKGRIIAFGGRLIKDSDKAPKYYNSPETIIFKKNEVLYGENLIKYDHKIKPNIILVEGYMDVIALRNYGINYAVASLGTATNNLHIMKLWKYSEEPIICLDSDAAGKKASWAICENSLALLKPGFTLRFLELKDAKDPDEMLKKYGKENFENLILKSTPISEYIWNYLYKKEEIITPEAKASFERKIYEIINNIKDFQVKKYYTSFFSNLIWQNIKRFHAPINHKLAAMNYPLETQKNEHIYLERVMIILILLFPGLLEQNEIYENFTTIIMYDREIEKIRNDIILYFDEGKNFDEIHAREYITSLKNYITNFLKFPSNIKKAMLEWKFCYLNHNLLTIQNEYNFYLKQPDSAGEKAYFLMEEIRNYKNKLEQIKHQISELI